MEISTEIFAWLSSLNIIRPPFKQAFYLPPKTLELFLRGKHMITLISYLQKAYTNTNYETTSLTTLLSQLKHINDDSDYISPDIKYENWCIINKILKQFDINYSLEQISQLVSGNTQIFSDVLNKIYLLCINSVKINNKLPQQTEQLQYNHANTNNSKYTKESSLSSSLNISDNNVNLKTSSSNNNYSTIIKEDYTLNDFGKNSDYSQCKYPFDFIIVSLCRNFNITSKQALALLAHKRKHLILLCNKGIKGNYTCIKQWLTDLKMNQHSLLYLANKQLDGKRIYYSTIGCGLYSKNDNCVYITVDLLLNLNKEIYCDMDWLIHEGIDMFIYCIIQNDKFSYKITYLLFELFHKKEIQLIDAIMNRNENTLNKSQLLLFFVSVLPVLNSINNELLNKQFINLILSTCTRNNNNSNNDLSLEISVLSNTWFYLINEIDDDFISYFLHVIDTVIIDKSSLNIISTAISHLFILIERFRLIRSSYAPMLYKKAVNILINVMNDEYIKEIILNNFMNFFIKNQTIPIEIMLSPYLDKLTENQCVHFCDVLFFNNIIFHPRMEYQFLFQMINISLHSGKFSVIITSVLNEDIIDKICNTNNQKMNIYYCFINYIKKILQVYLKETYDTNDKRFLQTAVNILQMKISEINNEVYLPVVNALKEYRDLQKRHSDELLQLLWCYDEYDTIMLQIEEENRDNNPLPKPTDTNLLPISGNENKKSKYEYPLSKLLITANNNHYKDISETEISWNISSDINNKGDNSFISKLSFNKGKVLNSKGNMSIQLSSPAKKSYQTSFMGSKEFEKMGNYASLSIESGQKLKNVTKGYINNVDDIRLARKKELSQEIRFKPRSGSSTSVNKGRGFEYHDVYNDNMNYLDRLKQMELINEQRKQINKLREVFKDDEED